MKPVTESILVKFFILCAILSIWIATASVITKDNKIRIEKSRHVLVVDYIATNGIGVIDPNDKQAGVFMLALEDTKNLEIGDFVNYYGDLLISGDLAVNSYREVLKGK